LVIGDSRLVIEVNMNKSQITNHESQIVEGVVAAQLPSGLYRVEIGGRDRVTAHVAGGAERNFVRLLVGDRVMVELAARDVTRGRIVRRV
jgi:translation initiation factor IF-1